MAHNDHNDGDGAEITIIDDVSTGELYDTDDGVFGPETDGELARVTDVCADGDGENVVELQSEDSGTPFALEGMEIYKMTRWTQVH